MIIHYCWFGGEKPEKVKNCIDSWKKMCPSFEIKEWNESNYDVKKNAFLKKSYESKKYAFVSDYARFDILANHGGIFLDTDVELLKDLTPLLDRSFMALERAGQVAPGLIIFAKEKNEKLFKDIINYYDNIDVTKFNFDKTSVEIVSEVIAPLGLTQKDEFQDFGDFVIYPSEYFNPMGPNYGKIKLTDNTYSIHHYMATWKSELDQKIMTYRVKYGVKKGNIFFILRHPFLAIKKRRSQR